MIDLFTGYFQSLQSRLSVFVILLTLLLAGISYTVFLNQLEIKETIAIMSSERTHIVNKKNSIQNDLVDSYKNLDTFLLDPRNVLVQTWTLGSLDNAIQTSNHMLSTEWVKSREQVKLIESISVLLSNLKNEVIHLTEIRNNPSKQYPSLLIATNKMTPNRVQFINSLSVILDTVDNTQLHNSAFHHALLNSRYLWTQLVSNFRIYLANQFGSFDLVILKTQEKAISDQYYLLAEILATLSQYDNGEYTFEVDAELELMNTSLKNWHDAYLEVQAIHNSGLWRIDLNILKTKIQPLLDEITYLLSLFDEDLEHAQSEEKVLTDKIIHNQLTLLFFVSSLVIILTMSLLLIIKIVIFKPIKHVTSAIKEEATGFSTRLLPQVYSSEAKDLVDAFNEMRKQIHKRQTDLTTQANHDSLTGLPNRKYFLESLDKQIELSKISGADFTVLLIDLNGFKDINDTLGHDIGDQLLVEISMRLIKIFHQDDFVSRLGGDEFAILLPNTDRQLALKKLHAIKECCDSKLKVDGINTYIGMSIGAAIYPEHGHDKHMMLKHADVAMYVAKRQKIMYAFYKHSDDSYTLNRLTIINDIKSSIDNNGLELYFQPKLSLNNNSLISVEALLRWNHPDLGLVMPDDFIAIAEQSGFINSVSYWVIEESLKRIAAWELLDFEVKVSVNLSVYNLFDADFSNNVKIILDRYPNVIANLIIEITESAMMTNSQAAIQNLDQLRDMGIKLSIDDYGTGFSSLSYLSQLSLNELKIDKSFIVNMLTDERKSIIVQSTIEMAHKLGLEVVAEGVETEEVLKRLESYGCNIIQGYFVSKPLPEKQLLAWLRSFQVAPEPA